MGNSPKVKIWIGVKIDGPEDLPDEFCEIDAASGCRDFLTPEEYEAEFGIELEEIVSGGDTIGLGVVIESFDWDTTELWTNLVERVNGKESILHAIQNLLPHVDVWASVDMEI